MSAGSATSAGRPLAKTTTSGDQQHRARGGQDGPGVRSDHREQQREVAQRAGRGQDRLDPSDASRLPRAVRDPGDGRRTPSRIIPSHSGPDPNTAVAVATAARLIGTYTRTVASSCRPGRRRTTLSAATSKVNDTANINNASRSVTAPESICPTCGTARPTTPVTSTRISRLFSTMRNRSMDPPSVAGARQAAAADRGQQPARGVARDRVDRRVLADALGGSTAPRDGVSRSLKTRNRHSARFLASRSPRGGGADGRRCAR